VIQNVIGVPSQALQVIFEMESQGTSQNKSSKENKFFSNCKMCIFSFFFVLTSLVFKSHNFFFFIHFKQFKVL
jgi:hypothetical protein